MSRQDWFDRPDERTGEPGLRFECTMCGNCCTGPTGYVMFTPDEAEAMAARLGVSQRVFHQRYSRDTPEGRSLREVKTEFGYDCVFLDRSTVPGKAVCSLYSDRPLQCRTWPFWKENLNTERDWRKAARTCPGINNGPAHTPELIRLTRDRIET